MLKLDGNSEKFWHKSIPTHLNDSPRSLSTHVMDCVLVTEPVGSFYLQTRVSNGPSDNADDGQTNRRTVSYICHRQSSSVMFYVLNTHISVKVFGEQA